MATELGERLNLALNFEGQVIANVYFHWSATTFEGLCMAIDIVKSLQNGVPTLSHNSLLLADFGLTMNSDAGYNEESLQYMNAHMVLLVLQRQTKRKMRHLPMRPSLFLWMNTIKCTLIWA